MIGHPSLGVYSLGVGLFHVGFSAVGPHLLGLLAVLDPSGRAPVRGIAATNIGFSFGSWSLTLLVAHWGYDVMLEVCAAAFTVCGALVLAAARGRSALRAGEAYARRVY